jgi:hypothetical protein
LPSNRFYAISNKYLLSKCWYIRCIIRMEYNTKCLYTYSILYIELLYGHC